MKTSILPALFFALLTSITQAETLQVDGEVYLHSYKYDRIEESAILEEKIKFSYRFLTNWTNYYCKIYLPDEMNFDLFEFGSSQDKR